MTKRPRSRRAARRTSREIVAVPSAEPGGEILLYQTEDGRARVECRFVENSLWMSQASIAELFQTTPQNVTQHLRALFQEGELEAGATCKDYLQVRLEGLRQVRRSVQHYSLDAILAVGYRVRSPRGTQFRRWATERLREYLVKGFVLDDERLKHPPAAALGIPDYFDELLERIRDIRASEARMYLRVRDIFALAADYDPSAEDTLGFFRAMQNSLHYSVTGKTAAELIASRADHEKPNMGLTSWKGSWVAKADVTVAKNYLQEAEIGELNRIVVMWLDFAEDQARRRKQIFLRDWKAKLDEFLRFNEREVLAGAGTVSHDVAVAKAETVYEEFTVRRRALLEAQGERDGVDAIEEAARQLEAPRKKTRRPSRGT